MKVPPVNCQPRDHTDKVTALFEYVVDHMSPVKGVFYVPYESLSSKCTAVSVFLLLPTAVVDEELSSPCPL